ncbi:hypothetical protein NDU88_007000 [Pleurodeles waltl]|uniref:Uncharacterized protein n=1 Tax=Pleurodeles waltl TaxID=8319 RepID=A0AAV7MLM3_PLEWA|nr:hypothetical protein NDU88_007000 [Pleurodeles waltl]
MVGLSGSSSLRGMWKFGGRCNNGRCCQDESERGIKVKHSYPASSSFQWRQAREAIQAASVGRHACGNSHNTYPVCAASVKRLIVLGTEVEEDAKQASNGTVALTEINENVKSTEKRQIKVKQFAKTTMRSNKEDGYGEQDVLVSRNKNEKSELTCYRTGSRSHVGNSKACVAVNQLCFKCGKRDTGVQGKHWHKQYGADRMIEKSYVESDEDENVILMLSSES